MTLTSYTDKFYQALAHLCYAIIATDKSVRTEEVVALRQLLNSEWPNEEEHPHPVQLTFEQLIQQKAEVKEAMNYFKTFKENNEPLFTENTKKRIWKTVNTLAESVAGKNKSELVLLSQLSALFDEGK